MVSISGRHLILLCSGNQRATPAGVSHPNRLGSPGDGRTPAPAHEYVCCRGRRDPDRRRHGVRQEGHRLRGSRPSIFGNLGTGGQLPGAGDGPLRGSSIRLARDRSPLPAGELGIESISLPEGSGPPGDDLSDQGRNRLGSDRPGEKERRAVPGRGGGCGIRRPVVVAGRTGGQRDSPRGGNIQDNAVSSGGRGGPGPGDDPPPAYTGKGRPRKGKTIRDRVPAREAGAILEGLDAKRSNV